MVKRVLFSLSVMLLVLFASITSVGASSPTITSGPFTGCTVGDNHVVNCPNGYATAYANPYALNGVPYACVAASANTDNLPVCGNYSYPYSYGVGYAPLQNVVAVYRDNRYCDGVVYITNESGNLINRCDNGVRVYPVYPDYYYPAVYVNP